MEYDKMPQIQLRRIEKYVEEIKNKKIQEAYKKGRELREKDEEKISNCKEIKDFRIKQKEFDLMEKKLRKKYKLCSINKKDISLDYDYNQSKYNKAESEIIAKIDKAHKNFTEQILFGDKPTILKAIRKFELL